MAKKEDSKKETVQPRGLFSMFSNKFDLTAASVIFSVLYFPLAVLMLEQTTFSNYLLLILTIVMILIGLASILIFMAVLSNMMDAGKVVVGPLIPLTVINLLLPLLMFKVYAYVIWKLLPESHTGFLCDLKHFVVDMYRIFDPQQLLNYLILGTLVFMGVLIVWRLGKK